MADVSLQPIASKLVKEIALFGGDIAPFVSPAVREQVVARGRAARAAGRTLVARRSLHCQRPAGRGERVFTGLFAYDDQRSSRRGAGIFGGRRPCSQSPDVRRARQAGRPRRRGRRRPLGCRANRVDVDRAGSSTTSSMLDLSNGKRVAIRLMPEWAPKPRRADQDAGSPGVLRRDHLPPRDRRLHGADRRPDRDRPRRLRAARHQGRVQHVPARARHRGDGPRAVRGQRQQPVLHRVLPALLARPEVHQLRPGDRRDGRGRRRSSAASRRRDPTFIVQASIAVGPQAAEVPGAGLSALRSSARARRAARSAN